MRIGVCAALSLVIIGCTGGRILRDSDGNAYAVTVMSDGRAWITTNLRLAVPGSYCQGDAASECLRLGRLYTWESAVQACTRLGSGWRLPTDDEWRRLANAYGGLLGDSEGQAASTDLLAGRPSGFNAVLGGNREASGNYARLDEHGFYWTATESDDEHAWFYNFGRLGLNRHRGGRTQRREGLRAVDENSFVLDGLKERAFPGGQHQWHHTSFVERSIQRDSAGADWTAETTCRLTSACSRRRLA